MDNGIGGTGQGYNTHRPFELSYLGDVALQVASQSRERRESLLSSDLELRSILIEVEGDTTKQSKDIILHLLFPEKYERIASRTHKRQIADAFGDLIDGEPPDDLDDKLFAIRTRLKDLNVARDLDFYLPPLRECWFIDGEDTDLTPLQALSIKRQVVLYGPPGTGKTFEARQLADRIIRQGLLRAWKPRRYFESKAEAIDACVASRTRRVQFHPGYSYEDFVRGLRLGEGGKTEYSDGVLLRVIEEIETAPKDYDTVPFVLILDELNRADLSKVLGECFSLFEDRNEPVQLGGQDEKARCVSLPSTLMIIGTMNLIDQSLEQIDFALRRRFLWFFRGFDRDQFLDVCKWRCERMSGKNRLKKDWNRFATEFQELADRAERVNEAIAAHPALAHSMRLVTPTSAMSYIMLRGI